MSSGTSIEYKILKLEEALRRVIVPGLEVNVVEAGLVSRIRVSRDGSKVAVFVRFKASDSSCLFCKFVGHTVWSFIVEDIKKAVKETGLFSEVYVLDDATLSEL